jgi:hypothetical protein
MVGEMKIVRSFRLLSNFANLNQDKFPNTISIIIPILKKNTPPEPLEKYICCLFPLPRLSLLDSLLTPNLPQPSKSTFEDTIYSSF